MSHPLRVLAALHWGLGERLLDALLDCPQLRLMGVVCRGPAIQPDPYAMAVRRRARQAGLPIWEQDEQDLGRLARQTGADLLWLHAYMRRLPPEVLAAAPLGALNVHASLLPAHRGPDPLHGALARQDARTGLTAHLMDQGLDTGPIVCQVAFAVHPGDTRETLLEKCKQAARPLVEETVRRLLDPDFSPLPQDEALASHAPRPERRNRHETL